MKDHVETILTDHGFLKVDFPQIPMKTGLGFRLGLGYCHGTATKEQLEATRQSMDGIARVMQDLVDQGLLTSEGKVIYEFAPRGYVFNDGETEQTLTWADVNELALRKDYDAFHLKKRDSEGDLDIYTFQSQGKTYLCSRPKGDCFGSVYDLLSAREIPLVFDEQEENRTALDAAHAKRADDQVQRLQQERREIFAQQLFSEGNGLHVLIVGFLDFPFSHFQDYNKEGHPYLFAVHEGVRSLRGQSQLGNS